MSVRARRSREAGFTLAEALVSLFVFGLISAGAVLMLSQAASAQRGISAAQDELRELQLAQAMLSSDLAQLTLRPTRDADGRANLPFTVEQNRVAFVHAAGEPAPDGTRVKLEHVEYAVEDGRIVRRSRSALDATPQSRVTERVLFTHASQAQLRYFDGVSWVETWQGSVSPSALAIDVTTARYGKVRIAALVRTGQ